MPKTVLSHRITLSVLLLSAGLLLVPTESAGRARADDATPSVIEVSPEPTAAPTVVEVPTVAPPPVRAEHTPTSAPTSVPPTPNTSYAIPTRAPIVVLPTATPYVTNPTYLLPSPAQLQESARLRWGSRVPTAVRRWAFLIVPAARRYGIDPNLIAAVITMESGGDPQAWNTASDARGLMQVLHASFDPAENIDAGSRMLAGFLDQYHDLRLALAAYNAGPGAVDSYGGIPPYRETRDYVIIVTYLYDLYSHRSLTVKRKAQYRSTIHDLNTMPRQRKKISLLRAAGHDHEAAPPAHRAPSQNPCEAVSSCAGDIQQALFPTMDPFWPMPGPADPLQHVGFDVSQP